MAGLLSQLIGNSAYHVKKTPSRIQTPGNRPKVRIQQALCTHFTADVQNNTFTTDTQNCGPQKKPDKYQHDDNQI
jgi:hypothetical protein